MRRLLVMLIFFALLAFSVSRVEARQDQVTPQAAPPSGTGTPTPGGEIQILSPKPGQALQGSVPVVVDTMTLNFKSVELDFGFMDDPTATWFLIFQGIQPVTGTMLVLWDTSTITDGDYNLRMLVTFSDDSQKSVEVDGIRVRNYTPVETSTPTLQPPTATKAPASTATATLLPSKTPPQASATPTPMGANPVVISRQDILVSAGKGALAILGLFALGGIYTVIRSLGRGK